MALTIMGTLSLLAVIVYLVYKSFSLKRLKRRTHSWRPTSKDRLVKLESGWAHQMLEVDHTNYAPNERHLYGEYAPKRDRLFERRPFVYVGNGKSVADKEASEKKDDNKSGDKRLPSLSHLIPAKVSTLTVFRKVRLIYP
jgi:hypothetical protein